MPKAAARIQQASLDTQSLVLGQLFIPNSPALCKGRIKKVTGGYFVADGAVSDVDCSAAH
jgi:hypothetical protein